MTQPLDDEPVIRATVEHVAGSYFASATDERTPWLRITACPHRHRSAAGAARCLTSTSRIARAIVQRATKAPK
jgi:hypothetical protein